MSDVAQGPGWWVASDGKWYPPESHPEAAPPPPPPSTGLFAPLPAPSTTGPATGLSATNWRNAMPPPSSSGPEAPLSSFQIPTVGGPPPGLPGAGPIAPGGSYAPYVGQSGGFDHNPYAMVTRGGGGPTPTRKRGRLPMAALVVIVLVVVVAVAGGGYFLLHPSVNRSPDAIATDFYARLVNHDYTGAALDIAPTQRAVAGNLGDRPEVVSQAQRLTHLLQQPTDVTSGNDVIVTLQQCTGGFSCSGTPPVPTLEVNGKWYVDFTAWDPNGG